jgi:hypothetical protein
MASGLTVAWQFSQREQLFFFLTDQTSRPNKALFVKFSAVIFLKTKHWVLGPNVMIYVYDGTVRYTVGNLLNSDAFENMVSN